MSFRADLVAETGEVVATFSGHGSWEPDRPVNPVSVIPMLLEPVWMDSEGFEIRVPGFSVPVPRDVLHHLREPLWWTPEGVCW